MIPKLKEASYFAGTCDFWTSPSTIPYLTYTVHLIDTDWSLRSFCLSTSLYEDHIGRNIAAALKDTLENWGLSAENLIATTTDNASNIVNAFNTLQWTRLGCFGHNLDFAVNKAIQCARVQSALEKCRRLLELFHRSWKKARDLTEKQQSLGLPVHILVGSVSTRWGSSYNMVERVVDNSKLFVVFLLLIMTITTSCHQMPCFQYWKQLLKFLTPLLH